MDTQRNIPKTRIAFIAILFWIVGLNCLFFPRSKPPGNPPNQESSSAPSLSPTVTKAAIPDGWKLSKDPEGACQVAAPPDWQLGKDFFLKAEKTEPNLFASKSVHLPPMGLALWGIDKDTQLPEGKRFQSRVSLVIGETVCSVWRIKASTDFTDAEKSEMQQVGKTLQGVR
jgi:hypothetical protein